MLSIRSQNRMMLVPYRGIIFISSSFPQVYKDMIQKTKNEDERKKLINDESKRVWLIKIEIDGNEDTLGTYKTKERCLEILDKIENCITVCMMNEESVVYYMPKEEE